MLRSLSLTRTTFAATSSTPSTSTHWPTTARGKRSQHHPYPSSRNWSSSINVRVVHHIRNNQFNQSTNKVDVDVDVGHLTCAPSLHFGSLISSTTAAATTHQHPRHRLPKSHFSSWLPMESQRSSSGTIKNNNDIADDLLMKEKLKNRESTSTSGSGSGWSATTSAPSTAADKWSAPSQQQQQQQAKEGSSTSTSTTAARLSELADKVRTEVRNVGQKVEAKLTGKRSDTPTTGSSSSVGDKPTSSSATYTSINEREVEQKSGVIGDERIKTSGAHRSIWQRTLPTAPSFPPLQRDITIQDGCDTVIIGAGISGLTIAYELIRKGRNVVVIDARQIVAGETGRTSAHLAYYMDDTIEDLMKKHGIEQTRRIVESHFDAINSIETIVKRHNIDCDFERVNGYLIQHKKSADAEKNIDKEWDSIHKCGVYPEAKLIPSVDAIEGMNCGKAIMFPNQAQFHPTKYLYHLSKVLTDPNNEEIKQGAQSIGKCTIYCGTHIVKYQGGDNAYVEAKQGHKVSARNIVMATNVPLNLISMIDSVAPYRTYCISASIPKSYRERHGSALFWDDVDPYHYVRLVRADDAKAESDWLVIGGEDHIVGRDDGVEPAQRYANLEKWAKERWPIGAIVDRWSGQVEEPFDDIASIGRNPHDHSNVYIVTGDSGMGLTHGTIAGAILSDMITKQANKYENVYDPSRHKIGAAPEYIAHNASTQLQFARWLAPLHGDVNDIEDLPRCSGMVTRDGLKPIAVYKDKDGMVHKCSAVCTHLKGIVRWNDDEKSWDCPLHGSRFSPYGEVLNAPAKDPLPKCDPTK